MLVRFFRNDKIKINTFFLIVVIGIVIYFVGNFLRSLLNNRQERILANFDEVKQKIQKVQDKLWETIFQYFSSKNEVQEIQNQNINKVEEEKKDSQTETFGKIRKIENLNKETLFFQQQKILNRLSERIIQQSLKQTKRQARSFFLYGFDRQLKKSIKKFYVYQFPS